MNMSEKKMATSKSSNRIHLEFIVDFDKVLCKMWNNFNMEITK